MQQRSNFAPFFNLILVFSMGAICSPDHSRCADLPPILFPQMTGNAQERAFPNLKLVPLLSGLGHITDIQPIPGNPHEVIVLEKEGKVYRASLKTQTKQVIHQFKVRTSSELGLLGIAFHPHFSQKDKTSKKIYFNSNPEDGKMRTQISEWTWIQKSSQEIPSLSSPRTILEIDQPYSNHNGGQIQFGPDGYLYIGMGDGGAAGDPKGHAQNPDSLLGKMLRIDVQNVSAKTSYSIPKDNPFVSTPGTRAEIWALGLRNPWRFSFGPQAQLIVADVGQNDWEEISIIEKGKNYGWNIMEGKHCYSPKSNCDMSRFTAPLWEYGRNDGFSITGGYVSTNANERSVVGQYIFGDFGSGNIWAMTIPPHDEFSHTLLGKFPIAISTFGRLANGDILVSDFNRGVIYKIDF